MSQTNSVLTADALLKDIYSSEGLQDLCPDEDELLKLIPLNKTEMEGRYFVQPVRLSREGGFTYAAAASGKVTLKTARAQYFGRAEVAPAQIYLTIEIDQEFIDRSSTTKKAFEQGLEAVLKGGMSDADQRVIISMLYGRSSHGLVTGVQGAASATSTTLAFVCDPATFATGIWNGAEGSAVVNVYYSTSTLVSSGADSVFVVTGVDTSVAAAPVLTLTGTSTGVTALQTAVTNNVCRLYYDGAFSTDMYGLEAIIRNTTTLFNIDAGAYSLWQGQIFDNEGGMLTLDKINQFVAKLQDKGLKEKVLVVMSHKNWYTLVTNEAALRQYDSSYSEKGLKNGTQKLEFVGSQGPIVLVGSNLVKPGMCFLLPASKVERLASKDWQLDPQSGGDLQFLQRIQGTNAYAIQLNTAQQVFDHSPAQSGIIDSIAA